MLKDVQVVLDFWVVNFSDWVTSSHMISAPWQSEMLIELIM
jgi:hypothetical protein